VCVLARDVAGFWLGFWNLHYSSSAFSSSSFLFCSFGLCLFLVKLICSHFLSPVIRSPVFSSLFFFPVIYASAFYRHSVLLPIFHDSDKAWDFVFWSDWDTNSPAIPGLLVVVSSTPQWLVMAAKDTKTN
jgi:hypothetical protein